MTTGSVCFGVPGLDHIFPQGIRPGSIILIAGPPGSGKTRLSMQLIAQMKMKDTLLPPELQLPSLFLSCDEHLEVLSEESSKMLPPNLIVPQIKMLHSHVAIGQQEILDSLPKTDAKARLIVETSSEVQVDARRRGAKNVLERIITLCSGKSTPRLTEEHVDDAEMSAQVHYNAICVDGLLNLREFRGVNADERRDALFSAVQSIRALIHSAADGKSLLAAVLTMEIGENLDPLVPQAIDYLADIVIRVGMTVPVRGARRRYLEVTKSRYAKTVLGEHALWIMAQEDVDKRIKANATIGWNRALAHICRGIVIFPRAHWKADQQPSPLTSNVEHAALNVRKTLSKLRGRLSQRAIENWPALERTIAKIMRGKPLDQQDAHANREFAEDLTHAFEKLNLTKQLSDAAAVEAIEQVHALAKEIHVGVQAHRNEQIQDQHASPTSAPRSSVFCTFGIRGLDDMFGTYDGQRSSGVMRGTSTVVVGSPGTGKSTLAYCFMLQGLEEGDDVVFLSFDERHKRILKQVGGLTVAGKDGERSRTLAEIAARQIVLAEISDREEAQLRFIHEHPVNMGLDELMFMLEMEIREPRRPSERHNGRACRLIIDSLSDLERNVPDALTFNSFVTTLLKSVSDWGITSLIVLEAASVVDDHPEQRAMSHLADNVIVLRQVQINNASRKCLTIQKARSRQHDATPAELVFRQRVNEVNEVEVRKGFEGMTNVLTGHPQPANIEVRLFHENARELRCNRAFLRSMRAKFGTRLRYVPISPNGARRGFWRQFEGRDIRPDADVTVLALDEPWVRIFSQTGTAGHPLLSPWSSAEADDSQRLFVAQLSPHLKRRALLNEHSVIPDGGVTALEPILAIPHYLDFGLLLRRTDLMAEESRIPTCWEDAEGSVEKQSFESIVVPLARRLKVPAFAFNMDSMDTTACVFIEMCWNFFASQSFLLNPSERDRCAASRALLFLARLRWSDMLPFPSTVKDCSKAIYARAWYANIPRIIAEGGGNIPFEPIPFLTAGDFRHETGEALKLELMSKVQSRTTVVEVALEAAKLKLAEFRSHDGYHDYVAVRSMVSELQNDLERLRRRREELQLLPLRHPGGWSCSGAWYLGVVSNGGNTNLGWSIVEEALDPRRVAARAFEGGGLPPYASFYRDHADKPVPGLAATFGRLEQHLLGRTRPRESALGIGMHNENAVTVELLELCRKMPEILHDLVSRVLRDERSDVDRHGEKAASFVRTEIDFTLRSLTVRNPV